MPAYPGRFAGAVIHSSAYKRPEPFRDQRVLVVGAGNSAADIAVDVSRVAARTSLSVREGRYVIPKLLFGRPTDAVYAFWRSKLPRPVSRSALKLWLRLTVGTWEEYGLPRPASAPLEKPPTMNSSLLEALRHGRVVARPGIERYDGHTVHFASGERDEFDTIVMGTGSRVSFPFLPERVAFWDMDRTPPLYLRMMHPTIPSLFFIGLFQPVGCIWRLADHQARIAALQISGRLRRPSDMDIRIRHELSHTRDRRGALAGSRSGKLHAPGRSPRHAIEVDFHAFRRRLMAELATAS